VNKQQKMVEEFMRLGHQLSYGKVPKPDIGGTFPFELRVKLLLEEVIEFAQACGFDTFVDANHDTQELESSIVPNLDKPDMINMIDGLCDILYVAYGAACAMGIDLEPFFKEVHESNMTKLDPNGGFAKKREDGKGLKPEGFKPPDLRPILHGQQAAADPLYQLLRKVLRPTEVPPATVVIEWPQQQKDKVEEWALAEDLYHNEIRHPPPGPVPACLKEYMDDC
jgi:predicted HAD superfamily Cof-like phosphohydrolase